MGQMHFNVPDAANELFLSSRWEDAYLCGIEGVPWQTRNSYSDGRFTLTRGVDTSAKLFLTCPIPSIGYRQLSTCSLRCLDSAHRLFVELARGSCYRVRVQADVWQRGGLVLNDRFDDLLTRGTKRFLDAAQCAPDDPACVDAALEAIESLELASSELGELFSTQSVAYRRSRENRLCTMLAVGVLPPLPATEVTHDIQSGTASGSIDEQTTIARAFNAAAVRISWGEIETDSGRPNYEPVDEALTACAQMGLRVIGGPIIDYRKGLLPDWLTLLEDDFEKLMSTMMGFVEKTVEQFRGRVNLWNAASGLNVAGPLGLDDEQVMRFSIGVLQTIRRCDPNTPVLMSLDQPCGEYLARDEQGISPLHFADALLRSGLGVAGIGLNFRFGFESGDTHPRSAVEFGQIIDRWATLNAPLMVQLSVAGAPGKDAAARLPMQTRPLSPEINGEPDAWAKAQFDFVQPLIQTLLSKQVVHAVVWDGWSDQHPHMTPHAGVIDAKGRPRPMLAYLTKVREEMLM
ncbi:glycoside hydrolase family 10 [Rhodopirellula halodulae]|uniref:glycoside hydrolase family 10 n=1 Tax=Rhodopirellula halodulae TaxID=2894198 RepID=UPI001E5D4EA2|nr:glycoside hydrolase family 10 [Rhodopirellula sp. JC740]